MEREVWKAVALLVGTQIGAGVLGLPYAIKGLGVFWGGVTILVAGVLMLLTALFLVESLYVTNPRYHLFDLIEHHFGRAGAVVFLILVVLAVYGALSAYLEGMGEALHNLVGGNTVVWGVLLWALLSLVVVAGLRTSANVETAAVALLILLFGLTVLWSIPYLKPYHVPISWERIGDLVTAFSVAVFAYFVHLSLPEAVRLVKDKRSVVDAIYKAFIITAAIYTLFSIAVISVLGENTPEISIFGLVNVFGPFFGLIAYLVPLFAMLTSFIGVGLGTVDMTTEYVGKRWLALLLILLPPLFIFLLGASFFGSILLGSLALVLAGGVVPSLLIIKIKRAKLIPHRVLVAVFTLLVFLFVFLWEVASLG